MSSYSYYERMKMLGASDPMIAAIDLVDDAGLLTDKRLELLVAAEQTGQNPEHFARHLIKLCRAAQGTPTPSDQG